jgi:transcriptional regulator with PAS, ATPase and Fis domain
MPTLVANTDCHDDAPSSNRATAREPHSAGPTVARAPDVLDDLLARGDSSPSRRAELTHAGLIGVSAALEHVMDQVLRVAATPRTTVLLLGESGVGKELVTRAIHAASARAGGPFVAVNCASLSDGLLESELFGYEPGAFTGGAPKGHAGLFAAAEGGTLLLDEVGELAPALQAKLLRVLQERTYRRVGSTRDLEFDARIVASTHRDLASMVAAGTFREDLFYRLNVMSLTVPPLRERREDVAPLAAHFLAQFAAEFGRSDLLLAPAALQRLREHPWPGNVRELRNVLERAALLATASLIRAEDLALAAPATAQGERCADTLPAEGRTLRAMEEALIRRVLAECANNRSRAAVVLGINRATLYNKLKSYQSIA